MRNSRTIYLSNNQAARQVPANPGIVHQVEAINQEFGTAASEANAMPIKRIFANSLLFALK